jgi:LysM repeat protein/uncharacterized protein (DUF2141 family)
MSLKKFISWLGVLAIAAAVFGVLPAATFAAPLAQSGNLLQNPGMEQPYIEKNQQGEGWNHYRYTIPKPDDASALQYSISAVFSAETNPSGKFPELIHGGSVSQHIGQQQDPWIGGISQVVHNIPAGSQVRFCAYARIYVNNVNYGKGEPSVAGYQGRSQVGIFPDGEALFDNPGIVWSAVANPHDTWENVCTTATVGGSGTVTVFTKNDWRGYAAVHLDAWWDDAELVVTGAQPATAAPTNQPAATTPQPQQPQPTPVPPVVNPDGSIVHTIVAGDTLFGLALQYDVSLDDLLALNNLTKDSILSIGQEIIIKGGTGTTPAQPSAGATPAEQSAATNPVTTTGQTEAVTPTPASVAQAPSSTAAKLCVRAFDDVNGDGLPSAGEESVAGVQFAVANSQGVQAASYTTDGSSQEHCFTDLPAGSYTVAVQPAAGTVATSDKRWGVALTGGSTVNINFGSRGDASAPAGSSPTGASESPQQSSNGSGLSGLLGGAIGLLFLLVAGVLGAFIIARRRA